jgi:glycerophosphoryl diester phosphodiesterase
MMRDAIGGVLASALDELRRGWRELLAAALFYQVVELTLLTPLLTLALRALVSLSGSAVLADQDILRFALSPVGLLALAAAAAAHIAVLAVDEACLMEIGFGAIRKTRVGFVSAVVWGAARFAPILAVTARLVVRVMLLCAPFLAAAALVYWLLLTDFDINYYLEERPPAFLVAAIVIASILSVMGALLVRASASWVYALPLLLFENLEPSRALRASADRSRGHRLVIVCVLLGGLVAALIVSFAGISAARATALALLPRFQHTLTLLVPALGAVVILGVIASALATAFSTSLFAVLFVALYERLGGGARVEHAPVAASASEAGLRSGKRLLAVVLVAALLSTVVGWSLLGNVRSPRDVAVIGHRGAAALAPENTLAAVERAIEDGADWVEIDVQETADGEVVLLHDSDFMKLAGSPLKIWNGSFAEVRELDVGSWFGPDFQGEGIATLEEVLLRARGRAKIVIELKYYGHDQRLEERVAAIVDRTGMEDDIAVMSLDLRGVERMSALRPDFRTGLLAATAVGRLSQVDVDFLAVSLPLATTRLLRQAHAGGKEVYVWTVNDEVTMAHQLLQGVDGLITDHPARARAVIEIERGLTSVERLLLGTAFWLGVKPSTFQISRDTD